MLGLNTVLQERYRIVRDLGHGGMGTVYEAVDQRVNCIVAIKETFAGSSEEARRAFEREASLLANLRHSALPKVMDYFCEDERDFLVMEFIPGNDLAELLRLRDAPFLQSQVLGWAKELLKVLEYLHGQQTPILHRDIKPANLKLTKQGEIFLLDFGLAKGSVGQMPTLLTNRSVRGYTPVYAALEQIHGQGTDPRSDLYSLGATLYNLLTGVLPTDAPTRFNEVEEDRLDPLQTIHKLNPQVSVDVASVIHQAMSISRKQRHSGALEMHRALAEAEEQDERRAGEERARQAETKRRREAERRRTIEVAKTAPSPTIPAKETARKQRPAATSGKTSKAIRREAPSLIRSTAEIHAREPNIVGASSAMAAVPTYMAPAIISIFLCWPLAIPAIIFAAQVNSKLAAGDIAGAVDSSKKAKMFSFIAIGLGVVLWLIYVGIFIGGLGR